MVDGINLEEVKEFARAFKLRRLSLGLTQTQVRDWRLPWHWHSLGQALVRAAAGGDLPATDSV